MILPVNTGGVKSRFRCNHRINLKGFKVKKLIPLTFTMLVSTYTSTVCADNNWYLGASYNAQDISSYSGDFNTAGLVAGYHYNKYFALETRFATGLSGYKGTFGHPESIEGSYNEDINSQISLSVKASYPIFQSFSLYGLAGYTKTKVEISGTGTIDYPDAGSFVNFPFKFTKSESGLSYGLGLAYSINEQFNLFIDYQVLPDFEPSSTYSKSWKSTTIGVNYSF